MATVDRLVLASTILFGTAGLLVLICISRPRWILSVNQGETSLGLIEMCITSSISNAEKCFIPRHIRSVWLVSFGLAIGAVGLLVLTVFLLLFSQYRQTSTAEYGRLTGFVAMIFLCFSTILFPMGFDSEIIGGSPFQLPADYRIGSSYIVFVGATWLTVLSVFVTGKMCLPRFVT